MALKKTYETAQGYEAEYWKVELVSVDKNKYVANCVLNCYKDSEQSTVEDGYVASRVVGTFTGVINAQEDFDSAETAEKEKVRFEKYFSEDSEYSNIYQACYNMAKELDEYFSDAEDC